MPKPPLYNPQTLASFDKGGLELAGLCSNGHAARLVIADNAALIAKFGPDARVQEVAEHIVCAECGSKIRVTVSAKSARGMEPSSFGVS
jgi:hypothetical protein